MMRSEDGSGARSELRLALSRFAATRLRWELSDEEVAELLGEPSLHAAPGANDALASARAEATMRLCVEIDGLVADADGNGAAEWLRRPVLLAGGCWATPFDVMCLPSGARAIRDQLLLELGGASVPFGCDPDRGWRA